MSKQLSAEEQLGEMLSQEMIRADAIWDEAKQLLEAKDAAMATAQQQIAQLRAALEGLEGGALIGDSPCFCYPWKTVLGSSLQHGEPCLAARAALAATEGQS